MQSSHEFRQRPIGDGLFKVQYGDRIFVLSPLPLKVVEIDRDIEKSQELGENILTLFNSGTTYDVPPFAGFGAIEFVATTHCNLRCTHCTARAFDSLDTRNLYYGMPAAHMPIRTMRRAIRMGIRQLEARLRTYPVRVPHFEMFITGGEPLLVWDKLRDALAYARELLSRIPNTDGYTFTPHIVTNGILIDDRIARELTASETVVTVALDSPFNQVRVYADGKAATPRAAEGLKKLVAAGHKQAIVNAVIAGEEMGKLDDVMSYLEGLGVLDGVSSIQLSPLAPPIAHTAHANLGLSSKRSGFNNSSVCERFSEKLIEYSHKYRIDMKSYSDKIGKLMVQGGTLYRCPVAEWKWAVTPAGDVYACHQLVGVEKFWMGNLADPAWYDAPAARAVRDRFLARTVKDADLCKNCVLGSTCMVFVDCPARSYLEMGDEATVAPHYCVCGKKYLEMCFGEHLFSLLDKGTPAIKPLCC